MKASLVLMALHVLNASLVVTSGTIVIFNLSKNLTIGQTHSNYQINMVIFATLWNALLNYYIKGLWALKTWKYLHFAQIYKLTILSDVQISNEGLMILENGKLVYQNAVHEYATIGFGYLVDFLQISIRDSVTQVNDSDGKIYEKRGDREGIAYMIDLIFKNFKKINK
ncbi:hypothetical protein RFI_05780 [Reticulomyxa filosa]|uniref:Uncharacterized protein n=1 Tax=Reticulomyxa filosa TaxID=46433 RepID=X6P1A8_RETFI|nr:hypothetical protein RFI_05780 [Reticulomyxa filosa]|eukprot:ETO31337.1 hypothetical protein RFI_05780 [Reticulomyxa filosa]